MAYESKVAVVRRGREFSILISESEASSADSAVVPQATPPSLQPVATLPKTGRIISVRCEKKSGSATTVLPRLERTTGEVVFEAVAAGLLVAEAPLGGAPYQALLQNLVFKSQADVGADNVIVTEFIIQAGLEQ